MDELYKIMREVATRNPEELARGLVRESNSPIKKYNDAKVKPVVRVDDLNDGEGKKVTGITVGIKVSF